MNAKQIQAAQRLTNLAQRANTFLSGGSINGEILWKLDTKDNMIIGSNVETLTWFASKILIIGYIGPRGGIKFYHVEGIPASLLH